MRKAFEWMFIVAAVGTLVWFVWGIAKRERQIGRCEALHGTYGRLNNDFVCFAPGGVHVIDVTDKR